MKNLINIIVLVATLALVGCSASVSQPPATPESGAAKVKDKPAEDNFDHAADAGRYVYNKATGFYEWIFSDDHKKKARKTVDTASSVLSAGWNSAIDAWKRHQEEGKPSEDEAEQK